MEKIRYLSLFSGIEAFSCAVKDMPEFVPVAFAEIEPFPCSVLAHHYPDVPNLGDVTKIDGKALRGEVDLIVGGSPCFVAGTMVLTPSGYRPIEDLQVGDEVVSANGNIRKVEATGHKTAPVGKLKILGRPEIVCTPNHPFLCFDVKMSYKGNKARCVPANDPEYTPAEACVKKYACRGKWKPIDMPKLPSLTGVDKPEDILELAGWYVGDGFLRGWKGRNRKAIVFGLVNEDKISAFIKRFPNIHYTITNIGHIHVYGTEFANWLLENFGQHAHEKRIPYWLYCSPYKEDFLRGYKATDGYDIGSRNIISSTSKALIYGIGDLADGSTIQNGTKEYDRPIKGKMSHHRATYIATIQTGATPQAKKFSDRWSSRVRWWIPLDEQQTVYNITVSEEHTYVACGIATHNCQGFSVAGLRKGLNDSRSSLAFAYIRLVKEIQPRWLLFENVPGILSCNHGQDFRSFLSALDDLNYSLAGTILDSQWFGVAQRRRRMFVVGCAGGDWESASKVFFESSCLQRNPPPRRKAGEEDTGHSQKGARNSGVSGTLCASGAGLDRPSASGNQLDYCIVDQAYHGTRPTAVAPTLDCRCGNGPRQEQDALTILAQPRERERERGSLRSCVRGAMRQGLQERDQHNRREARRGTASGKDTFPTLCANCGDKLWLGNQEAFSGDYFIREKK